MLFYWVIFVLLADLAAACFSHEPYGGGSGPGPAGPSTSQLWFPHLEERHTDPLWNAMSLTSARHYRGILCCSCLQSGILDQQGGLHCQIVKQRALSAALFCLDVYVPDLPEILSNLRNCLTTKWRTAFPDSKPRRWNSKPWLQNMPSHKAFCFLHESGDWEMAVSYSFTIFPLWDAL